MSDAKELEATNVLQLTMRTPSHGELAPGEIEVPTVDGSGSLAFPMDIGGIPLLEMAPLSQVRSMRVFDDAMIPRIQPSCKILIDTSRNLAEGKIYAIQQGSEILVRRLIPTQDGIRIRADSLDKNRFPDEVVGKDQIKIIGRVIVVIGDQLSEVPKFAEIVPPEELTRVIDVPMVNASGAISLPVRQVEKYNFSDLRSMINPDEAMRPKLRSSDQILIDTSQNRADGRIYAIRDGDEIRIRRLEATPDGICIRADNPDKNSFPDRMVGDDQIEIIGRVVFASGV